MTFGRPITTLGVAALMVSGMMASCGERTAALPLVSLTADSEIVWEGWTPTTFASGGDTIVARTHYRGGHSSAYPKHSIALKMPERYALCGLPADKDWILNASYIDKSFMRHKLGYDLFRAMNPAVNRAPLCSYAMVELNEQPMGLYVVMQKMDASTLGIAKGDPQAVVFKEPPLLYPTPIEPQDADNYYHQTYPKKSADDRTAQIEALRELIFASDDSVFYGEVAKVIDLDNIADWHLLLMLSNNADGILKNFFLYKASSTAPYRIAPWDYDLSFGRDGDNEYNMLRDTADCEGRSMLFARLMKWADYRERLSGRWHDLRRRGIVSEERLAKMVQDNAERIAEAVHENESLWPVDAAAYFDDNHFEDELAVMSQFIGLNIARLDRNLGYDASHGGRLAADGAKQRKTKK